MLSSSLIKMKIGEYCMKCWSTLVIPIWLIATRSLLLLDSGPDKFLFDIVSQDPESFEDRRKVVSSRTMLDGVKGRFWSCPSLGASQLWSPFRKLFWWRFFMIGSNVYNKKIHVLRSIFVKCTPFSDEWCSKFGGCFVFVRNPSISNVLIL